MKISRKKLLVGLAAIALVAIVGTQASTLLWTSCSITMHAGTGEVVTIGQYEDCAATIPFNSYDWGAVSQGQVYQVSVFIKNTGNKGVFLTYLPTLLSFYGGQAQFVITVYAVKFGLPCQLSDITLPIQLPEKDIGNPGQGFWLDPGKMVKLDVNLLAVMLVSGGVYDFTFTTFGAAP